MKKNSLFDHTIESLDSMRKTFLEVMSAFQKIKPYYSEAESEDYLQATEKYPDPTSGKNKNDLPTRSRGKLTNQLELCTACEQCVFICPTRAIAVDFRQELLTQKRELIAFQIHHLKCIQCGLCVDYCPPESLRIQRSLGESHENVSDFVDKQELETLKSASKVQMKGGLS
jgi:formate hydrogenlyase subunit 6/NADH:ubiquinone oxidoreductase subunit I